VKPLLKPLKKINKASSTFFFYFVKKRSNLGMNNTSFIAIII